MLRISIFFAVLLSFFSLFAQDSEVEISPSGYLYWEFGVYNELQEDRGQGGATYRDQIFQSITGGLSLGIQPHPRLLIRVTHEARTFNYLPKKFSPTDLNTQVTQFETVIEEANAALRLGDIENPSIVVQAGMFLHKYNPDAKVLGEYLMRSNPYPHILVTKFDYAKSKLMGVRVGHRLNEMFSHEVIINSEYERAPQHDFSLGYITDVTLLEGAVNLGAGIDFHHIIPVRPSITTPKDDGNLSVFVPAQDWVDSVGATHNIPNDTAFLFTAPPDTMQDGTGGLHPNVVRESEYLSFQGTKLMGRLTLDPKPLMGVDIFGKEDLRLYGEVAVLGWKDYAVFYDDRRERIPFMVGFNFPAFKILDVISLEIEYYPSKIPPSYRTADNMFFPVPGTAQFSPLYLEEDNKRDDWKWMVYARRGFFNSAFQLIGQVGLDHNRFQDNQLPRAYADASINPSQWYYQLRLKASY